MWGPSPVGWTPENTRAMARYYPWLPAKRAAFRQLVPRYPYAPSMLPFLINGDFLGFLIVGLTLVVAISLHEFGHALADELQGDPTARLAGRLTVNPMRHLDPFGTLMIALVGFGWGRADPHPDPAPGRLPGAGGAAAAVQAAHRVLPRPVGLRDPPGRRPLRASEGAAPARHPRRAVDPAAGGLPGRGRVAAPEAVRGGARRRRACRRRLPRRPCRWPPSGP